MSSSFQFIFLCSIDQSKVKSTDKKWRNGPAPSKVSSIDQWWIRVHYKRSGTVCYCPIISCKFLLTARIGSVSVDFLHLCLDDMDILFCTEFLMASMFKIHFCKIKLWVLYVLWSLEYRCCIIYYQVLGKYIAVRISPTLSLNFGKLSLLTLYY